jgi:hypothetical protein
MYRQIENFRAVHGARLDASQRDLLDRFFDPRNPRATARLLAAPRRFRQSLVGEALFRALLLANIALGKGLLPASA